MSTATLTPERALQLLLERVQPLAPVSLPLAEALGCVLAGPLVAAEDIPPFTNSAMDGFAVRAADLLGAPAVLQVVGELPAGRPDSPPVQPGQAVRIMTGAPLPEGADCVVPVEDTLSAGDTVRIGRALPAGANIRLAGEDLGCGERVLEPGAVLRSAELGVCASLGLTRLAVHPAARVAVISTGDELVEPGRRPGPGQIRDSNSTSMAAQVREIGGRPQVFARVADTREALRGVLEQALAGADAVMTSGGVSMGEYDCVKEVLAELGAELLFWRVEQKPGRPLACWLLQGKPVFGLPGNPVSTMVCAEEYVRPVLRKMMGHRLLHRPVLQATLAEGYRRKPDGRLHFLRVRVEPPWCSGDARPVARTTGPQGSGILSSMMRANALALIPPEVREVPPGGPVWLHCSELPEDH